jgi:hypothetical protein
MAYLQFGAIPWRESVANLFSMQHSHQDRQAEMVFTLMLELVQVTRNDQLITMVVPFYKPSVLFSSISNQLDPICRVTVYEAESDTNCLQEENIRETMNLDIFKQN